MLKEIFCSLLLIVCSVWAQSDAEFRIYQELLELEAQMFDLSRTTERRMELLQSYLSLVSLSLELYPQGHFNEKLRAIAQEWEHWKQGKNVTINGYSIEMPRKKGMPKPDLYLKCFVDQKLVFQTKPVKNQFKPNVVGDISFSFRAGSQISFELWDKDVFKDDRLDSVLFKSVCLQELLAPLKTKSKSLALTFQYKMDIPQLSHLPENPQRSLYLKAFMACENQNYRQAIDDLVLLAEQSYAPAQAKLGECFFFGHGEPIQPIVAFAWFQKAAEQGQSDGQYYMGYLLLYGQGVERDEQKARYWLELASQQGHGEARFELGKRSYEGNGAVVDLEKGLLLLQQAAKAGSASASLYLQKIKAQSK